MVNNSPIINNINNYLSPQIIEYLKRPWQMPNWCIYVIAKYDLISTFSEHNVHIGQFLAISMPQI
jgi:hypothetical protein